jgi:hypothetical protein
VCPLKENSSLSVGRRHLRRLVSAARSIPKQLRRKNPPPSCLWGYRLTAERCRTIESRILALHMLDQLPQVLKILFERTAETFDGPETHRSDTAGVLE